MAISLLLYRGGGAVQTAHSGNVRLWLMELYEKEFAQAEQQRRAEEQGAAPAAKAAATSKIIAREVRREIQPKLSPPAVVEARKDPARVAEVKSTPYAAQRRAAAEKLTKQILAELAVPKAFPKIHVVDYAAERKTAFEREEEELTFLMLLSELD